MPYFNQTSNNNNKFQNDKSNVKKLYRKTRKRYCKFCIDEVEEIDWKDVKLLRKYISEAVKIIPRSKSGNCAKHQKQLNMAVKRARIMALLPFTIHQLEDKSDTDLS